MKVNKYKASLYAIFFNAYLLFFWFAPLVVTDAHPNKWVNVLGVHSIAASLIGFCLLIGWLQVKAEEEDK